LAQKILTLVSEQLWVPKFVKALVSKFVKALVSKLERV
jgi:hypothetical protein